MTPMWMGCSLGSALRAASSSAVSANHSWQQTSPTVPTVGHHSVCRLRRRLRGCSVGVAHGVAETNGVERLGVNRCYNTTPGRHTPWAQFNLGVMYEHGEGAPQDRIEAVKWYMRTAEHGHADVQSHLGVMYEQGSGATVRQGYIEAVKRYRLAADQMHHANACKTQSNLGGMYANSTGVPQDYVEAVKWFRLAAEHGHADVAGSTDVVLQHRSIQMYSPRACRCTVQPRYSVRQWLRCAARLHQSSTIDQASSRPRGCRGDHRTPIIHHRHLFPPGTTVMIMLVGLKVAALNGTRGGGGTQQSHRTCSRPDCSRAGGWGNRSSFRITGDGTKAIPYEKLERI
jgi:TPR repeat protein